jgi:hypothetical protein
MPANSLDTAYLNKLALRDLLEKALLETGG